MWASDPSQNRRIGDIIPSVESVQPLAEVVPVGQCGIAARCRDDVLTHRRVDEDLARHWVQRRHPAIGMRQVPRLVAERRRRGVRVLGHEHDRAARSVDKHVEQPRLVRIGDEIADRDDGQPRSWEAERIVGRHHRGRGVEDHLGPARGMPLDLVRLPAESGLSPSDEDHAVVVMVDGDRRVIRGRCERLPERAGRAVGVRRAVDRGPAHAGGAEIPDRRSADHRVAQHLAIAVGGEGHAGRRAVPGDEPFSENDPAGVRRVVVEFRAAGDAGIRAADDVAVGGENARHALVVDIVRREREQRHLASV